MIAEQHVGALHLIERRFESLRDGLFHETLFQTDAQISADDFHDVFGFERRGAPEKLPQQSTLSRAGPARGGNLGERALHVRPARVSDSAFAGSASAATAPASP